MKYWSCLIPINRIQIDLKLEYFALAFVDVFLCKDSTEVFPILLPLSNSLINTHGPAGRRMNKSFLDFLVKTFLFAKLSTSFKTYLCYIMTGNVFSSIFFFTRNHSSRCVQHLFIVYSSTTSCLKCAAFISFQVFYNIRKINHQISFSFKL